MKRSLAITVLALLTICGSALSQNKTVMLQYKFKKGSTDTYKMIMSVKMTMADMPGAPEGGMKTATTATVVQKVMDVYDNGSAKIKTTIKNVKSTGMGMNIGGQAIKPTVITTVMTKDGKVKSMTGINQNMPKGMPGMNFEQVLGQASPGFPGRPVAIGDTWKQAIPMPNDGGIINSTSTLLSTSAPIGKYKTAKIKQIMTGNMDIAALMKAMTPPSSSDSSNSADMMSQIKGTVKLTGWAVSYFSAAIGKPIKSSVNSTAVITTVMPSEATSQGAPAQMNMIMDMKMDFKRVN